ncbi:SH3 domain-containing protein [Streptomyces sp. NPDC003038]|uniref:SH3 domain-containing protein n=1 Tax=unclassified Streptomyces TaxID=2593676 RepID=UPI0033B6796F
MTVVWNSCGYHPSTNLKLRTGPSSRHTAIGLLTPKDSVQILQERKGFYQVELEGDSQTGLRWGTKGWVSKHLTPHVCMRLNGRRGGTPSPAQSAKPPGGRDTHRKGPQRPVQRR